MAYIYVVYTTRTLRQGVRARHRKDTVTNRKLSHIYLNTTSVVLMANRDFGRFPYTRICYTLFYPTPPVAPRHACDVCVCFFMRIYIFKPSYRTAIRFSLLGFIQTAAVPAGRYVSVGFCVWGRRGARVYSCINIDRVNRSLPTAQNGDSGGFSPSTYPSYTIRIPFHH